MAYLVNRLVIFFVVKQSVARPICIRLWHLLALTHWKIVCFSFVRPLTMGFAKWFDVGGIDLRVGVEQVARLKQVLGVMVL